MVHFYNDIFLINQTYICHHALHVRTSRTLICLYRPYNHTSEARTLQSFQKKKILCSASKILKLKLKFSKT